MARKPVIPAEIVEKLVLLLVSNLSSEQIAEAARKLDVAAESVPRAIAEARRRITIAADFHRDEQVGTAFVRLNDLYRRSLAIQDAKTALAAQKEINKLLDLYSGRAVPITPQAAADDSDAEAARSHLAALKLAPPSAALSELCRLAVARIVELESQRT